MDRSSAWGRPIARGTVKFEGSYRMRTALGSVTAKTPQTRGK